MPLILNFLHTHPNKSMAVDGGDNAIHLKYLWVIGGLNTVLVGASDTLQALY